MENTDSNIELETTDTEISKSPIENDNINKVKIIISILTLIIIGGGLYFYIQTLTREVIEEESSFVGDEIKDKYSLYTNSDNGYYQLELPSSWNTFEEDGGVYAFPIISSHDVYEIHANNEIGITITTITPSTPEKLDDSYSLLFGDLEVERFNDMSESIVEVRSGEIEEDEDLPGLQGMQYAIKTSKRAYVINVLYRDPGYYDFQMRNIEQIIKTLREDMGV